MTVHVPLSQLAETLAHYDSGLLITSPAGTWPRMLTVDPEVDGEELVVRAPHADAFGNAAANPLVTLVWQPRERHGYTLIVDGWATLEGDDLRVRLDHAVLHRPGTHADGPPPPPHLR